MSLPGSKETNQTNTANAFIFMLPGLTGELPSVPRGPEGCREGASGMALWGGLPTVLHGPEQQRVLGGHANMCAPRSAQQGLPRQLVSCDMCAAEQPVRC